ncbi:MAG: DnaJ domain-containing protein [Gammaproteobacteria bacterium]|nr:DnaJ domain-containing protein [Gammaproteobacteria bacterium]MBU1776383.1 DnaJ domain-containing protein [Gammaproteobacteria bacterium]MBU1969224.1 DnaJ domain-containing protein [Gammaproteobacteria bacterium]
MKRVSYYEVLEVDEKASPEVIKAAYKSLMQRYHPDRNPGDAEAAERCVRIAQAYAVISDADKRASYDRELNRCVASDVSEARVRNILAVAARKEDEARYKWLWLLFIPFVLVIAVVFFLYGTNPPIAVEPKQIASALAGDEPGVQTTPTMAYAIPVEARTLPSLFNDVKVILVISSTTDQTPSAISSYELSIKSISVVAGDFDPDKYMSFMESNREYIEQKLIEKLAAADLMHLIGPDGERYLKRLILEELAEITGAGQNLSSSSSRMDRYGAEDILLPDSFSVTPLNSDGKPGFVDISNGAFEAAGVIEDK